MPAVRHSPAATARVNGIDICYDSFGDPSEPPLVLIMGLAAQMIAWDDEFCTMLAGRGRHVVRFDNRDIGLSTKFDAQGVPNVLALFQQAMAGQAVAAPYTLSDMAADVIGLLDVLDIGSAHVVGASMGGAIAQTLAIEHPARLRTMTAIMATSGAPGLPPPKPEALQLLLSPTPTEQAAYYERYVKTWTLLRGPGFPQDEARDLDRAAQIYARGLSPAGVARQIAAILASGSRAEQLAGVRVPTLVIHGDADPLVPVECGIDIARRVPNAAQLIVEGMGHALPIPMWPRIVDAIAAHTAAH